MSESIQNGDKQVKSLNIAVLPGDGIGPEIVEQALNVTKAVCEKFGQTYV